MTIKVQTIDGSVSAVLNVPVPDRLMARQVQHLQGGASLMWLNADAPDRASYVAVKANDVAGLICETLSALERLAAEADLGPIGEAAVNAQIARFAVRVRDVVENRTRADKALEELRDESQRRHRTAAPYEEEIE